MAKNRVLLSTFEIQVKNRSTKGEILSNIGTSSDFFDVCMNFLKQLELKPVFDGDIHVLEIVKNFNLDKSKRVISGFFDSGIKGDNYRIRDVFDKKEVFDVNEKHGAYRDIYFYFYLPEGRKQGYLVLQRKSNFGIKTILSNTLTKYFKQSGFEIYELSISNVLHNKVYQQMVERGKLNHVQFVEKKIPSNLEDYYENNGEKEYICGESYTIYKAEGGLPDPYKWFVDKFFTNRKKHIEDKYIRLREIEFSELSFELELHGKKKTFHVINPHRIQPDIDVTNGIIFDSNNEPIESSLAQQAQELIDDIIQSENVIQNQHIENRSGAS